VNLQAEEATEPRNWNWALATCTLHSMCAVFMHSISDASVPCAVWICPCQLRPVRFAQIEVQKPARQAASAEQSKRGKGHVGRLADASHQNLLALADGIGHPSQDPGYWHSLDSISTSFRTSIV